MMPPAEIRADGDALLARHEREHRDMLMRQRAEMAALIASSLAATRALPRAR